MRLWIATLFVLLPSLVEAGPITGCVTELPVSFTFTTKYHLVVGAWEDAPGCHPSTVHARPTSGPYFREFFMDGSQSVTVYAAQFSTVCSTQLDIREVDSHGNIVGYHDFIYSPTTANAVACRASHESVKNSTVPLFDDYSPVVERRTTPCPDCGVNPLTPTLPVPDSGGASLVALLAFGLAIYQVRKAQP